MDQNPKTRPDGAGAEDRPGHDLLSLSMLPVRQSLRLYAEIQRSALETFSRLGSAWPRPFTGKSSERAQTAVATPRPTSAQTPVATPRPASAKPTTAPPSGAPSKPAATTRPAATTKPAGTTKPAPPKIAAKRPATTTPAATSKPAAAKRPATTKPAAVKAASSTPVRAGGHTAHQDPAPKPGPKGAGGPQPIATPKAAAASSRRRTAPGGEAPKA